MYLHPTMASLPVSPGDASISFSDANAQASEKSEIANAAAAAIANYVPPVDDSSPAQDVSRSHAPVPAGGASQQSQSRDSIDSKALIEKIAAKWEKEGKNPASIQILREPLQWMRLAQSDQPILAKLAKDLSPSDLAALRKQAVRLIRDTPIWKELLDDRQRANKEPGVSRSMLHHRLVANYSAGKIVPRRRRPGSCTCFSMPRHCPMPSRRRTCTRLRRCSPWASPPRRRGICGGATNNPRGVGRSEAGTVSSRGLRMERRFSARLFLSIYHSKEPEMTVTAYAPSTNLALTQAPQGNAIPPGYIIQCSCAVQEQTPNNAASTAFTTYTTTTLRPVSTGLPEATTDTPTIDHAQASRKQPVNVRDAIERITRKWAEAGEDPASIDLIKAGPNRWINTPVSKQSVILKLARALQSTGELETLRQQAIRISRSKNVWQLILNQSVEREPKVSRHEHDRRLVEEKYGWELFSPQENIRVLGLIVHMNLTGETRNGNAVPADHGTDRRRDMSTVVPA